MLHEKGHPYKTPSPDQGEPYKICDGAYLFINAKYTFA